MATANRSSSFAFPAKPLLQVEEGQFPSCFESDDLSVQNNIGVETRAPSRPDRGTDR